MPTTRSPRIRTNKSPKTQRIVMSSKKSTNMNQFGSDLDEEEFSMIYLDTLDSERNLYYKSQN